MANSTDPGEKPEPKMDAPPDDGPGGPADMVHDEEGPRRSPTSPARPRWRTSTSPTRSRSRRRRTRTSRRTRRTSTRAPKNPLADSVRPGRRLSGRRLPAARVVRGRRWSAGPARHPSAGSCCGSPRHRLPACGVRTAPDRRRPGGAGRRTTRRPRPCPPGAPRRSDPSADTGVKCTSRLSRARPDSRWVAASLRPSPSATISSTVCPSSARFSAQATSSATATSRS